MPGHRGHDLSSLLLAAVGAVVEQDGLVIAHFTRMPFGHGVIVERLGGKIEHLPCDAELKQRFPGCLVHLGEPWR